MSSSDDDSLGDISDTQDSDGNQSFGGDEDSNQSSSDDEITFNTRSNNDGVKIMEASEEVEPVDDLKEQDDDKNNNSSKSEFPSWKGDRLYPPVRHSSNPSPAWKQGGFRKNHQGELVTDVTVCGICGKEIKYRNTPSHLSQHLKIVHSQELDASEKNAKKVDQPTVQDFFSMKKGAAPVKYKYNRPKQKRFRKTTVEWVVENNRPISVVEDKKLKLRRLSVQIQSSRFPALSRYFFHLIYFLPQQILLMYLYQLLLCLIILLFPG